MTSLLYTKQSQPQHIHLHIEAECKTEAARDASTVRLSHVHELLTPCGSCRVDKMLLNSMFDIMERTMQWFASWIMAANNITSSATKNPFYINTLG